MINSIDNERIIAECIEACIEADKTYGTREYPFQAGRIAACRTIFGDREELKRLVMAAPRAVATWLDYL
jgi:hypothetical protein